MKSVFRLILDVALPVAVFFIIAAPNVVRGMAAEENFVAQSQLGSAQKIEEAYYGP